MDINKDNENIATNNAEDTIPETSETEENTSLNTETEAETAQPAEEEVFASTLSVDAEDIDRELSRYGISDSEEFQPEEEEMFADELPKSGKCPVQKPIIIAAVAFLLTAAIVLGTMFVYKAFTKPALIGSWSQAGDYSGSMFLSFEEDGTVSLDMGGIERYGSYTTEKVQGYDVIHTEFYELALISKELVASYSEDKKVMNLYFLYEGTDLSALDLKTTPLDTVAMGNIQFNKGEKPALDLNPADITHASADEFGVTELKTDDAILGSWQIEIMGAEGKFETYTFNADGTGTHTADYVYYETYGCGLGEILKFKYTVSDGKIFMTNNFYDGSSADQILEYTTDKGNLIINGAGYEAVK
ncbi:MAG: hypothetical protein IJA62_02195 [Ruminococcus sp.]|nr:hypothetical protein [Ruminococcus sp.]